MVVEVLVGAVAGAVLAVVSPKVYAYVKSKIVKPVAAEVEKAEAPVAAVVSEVEKKI